MEIPIPIDQMEFIFRVLCTNMILLDKALAIQLSWYSDL